MDFSLESISGSRFTSVRYALAVALAVIALGLRLALDPVLGAHAPYLPFILAILVTARVGGRGAGAVVTVLSALTVDWFILEPRQSLVIKEAHAITGVALFLVVGLLVAWLVGDLRSTLIVASRAERALRHQTRLVDLAHDAIITMDGERRITAWNRGAREVYGYTESEALGQRIHDFLQTRGEVPADEIDAILARDGRWEGELDHTGKDGRHVRVESRHVLLRGDGREPASMLEINRDVTLRARAEQAVRESEERLRALVMATADLVFRMSPDWHEMRRVRGEDLLAELEPPNRTWVQDHIPPEDQPRFQAAVDEAIRTGRTFELEHRVIRADGSPGWSFSRAIPVRDAHGKIIEWFGTSTGITRRKQAEEALRESEERLALAIEFTELGAFDYHPQTGRMVWSDFAKRHFGLSADASVDYDLFLSGLHPDDREMVTRTMALALQPESGGPYAAEFRTIGLEDGKERWLSAWGRALFDADGHAVRLIGVSLDITGRKALEEEVRRRAEEIRTVMDVAPVAIWVGEDPTCRTITGNRMANEFYEAETGENVSAMSTRARRFFQNGRELRTEEMPMQRAARSGIEVRNAELDVLLPSGAWIHILGNASPLRNAGGAVRGCVGTFIDITGRKNAEQALRESEQRYRALFDSMQEGFIVGEVICDQAGDPIDWRYVQVNRAMAAIMGLSEEQVVGRSYRELFPESDWLYWVNAFGRVALTGTPVSVEHYGNETRRHYHAIIYSPAPRHFAAVLTDITERTRAEQALQESERRYRSLFESMQEAFALGEILTDDAGNPVDWRYLDVNPAFERMFGRSRDEVAGRRFREVYPESRSEYWVRELGQVAVSGAPARLEHYSVESARHYEVIAYSPQAGQFAAVFTDTSDRKLAEERLREAQKMESIGLLAGGVAHDFNNLLTVILGNASSALEECPSCEYARPIVAAAERAAHLTRQLLAYAGKGRVVSAAVDLSGLVSQSSELLNASLARRVELVLSLAPDLPLVEEDPSRLEQVLMNLVINAGEAIAPKTNGRIEVQTGSAEVTLEQARRQTRSEVKPGLYAWLEVRDNGLGMDESTLARVFDPFFSTKFTGRGLGLAAVDGIVRSRQGFIEVRSTFGSGTTFRVYLPASGAEREVGRTPVAKKEPARQTGTVLVVDDEEMVRRLARLVLRRYGYEVLEAADGRQALEMLRNCGTLPVLALLDIAMPVMGGDELVPILAHQYPAMKILISSGHPEEETRKGLMATGLVAGYLQKPYTSVALTHKVAEILGEE